MACRKVHVFCFTFLDIILMIQKSTLFSRTFFRCNFSGWNFDVISTMQCISLFLLIFLTFLFLFSRRFSCVFNFEQLTFARLFPLKFSSGPLPLKFVSFLQNLPFQKELLQVNFLCIYRTATLPNNFYIAMKLLL